MEMRLAGKTSLPGQPDRLANRYLIANLDERAVLLEVDVFRESSVGVFDDHVVCIRPEIWSRPADIGILFRANNSPLARSANDRADRNRPVDRVLAGRSSKVTKASTRALHDDVTARSKGHRV